MTDWIETSTGNRISRKAEITGSDRILIRGNCTISEDVKLQGDVPLGGSSKGSITIGKYCYFGKGSVVVPPRIGDGGEETLHGPVEIGSYNIVGERCKIRSASIGSRVLIEEDCTLGDLSIIYDCCVIRRGTVVPPRMIIPPYSDVSGVPGENFLVEELPNSYKHILQTDAKRLHVLG
ncbi:Piso0_003009 [Millerozyma farinosa CBS 7064]|uniref:Dynactin subunit 5 n=1 Tax=Pichia sorbitophila (strain ATCC MYA-4447 / BCRC 22081 / CBS 7064 / NBRC 10061 / NRRL Y-12695) TaxID=559304 RepID=G8YK37_PICSO|nr:Piso0_003009 [Millerozyma farinosa CBS 7064]CCE80682.1 Piso0_003009 [Millerozyma farinosa CBS 7064]